jgi:hypothetical protein
MILTLPTALFKQVIQHTVIATSTQEAADLDRGEHDHHRMEN